MRRIMALPWRKIAETTLLITGIAVVSLWVALKMTAPQTITVAGQTVSLSASPGLDPTGPGEVDLFGEPISTTFDVTGPIRPKLEWARLAQNEQYQQAVANGSPDLVKQQLSAALSPGWHDYFLSLLKNAILAAGILGAVAALIRRHRLSLGLTVVVGSMCVATLVSYFSIYSTSHTLRSVAGSVSSLDQFVGRTPLHVDEAKADPIKGAPIVVIGDSTAAGVGNEPLDQPTDLDRACGRSQDSAAADIARYWNVLTLACTGAKIQTGLFQPQQRHNPTIPSQLGVLEHVASPKAVIVSIGANEMDWRLIVALCVKSPVCDDNFSSALFDYNLKRFTLEYNDLLRFLKRQLPQTKVLINLYYYPLDPHTSCPGITDWSDKARALSTRLSNFNQVLQRGATDFGFTAVQPDFSGHEFCTDRPFVQGPSSPDPLHPNVAGEEAIANADLAALIDQGPTP